MDNRITAYEERMDNRMTTFEVSMDNRMTAYEERMGNEMRSFICKIILNQRKIRNVHYSFWDISWDFDISMDLMKLWNKAKKNVVIGMETMKLTNSAINCIDHPIGSIFNRQNILIRDIETVMNSISAIVNSGNISSSWK